MKIEHIRLVNFRQFFGEQTADFSTLDDLNVTVFHGSNGAGKTSLFSAINWCLYDQGVEDIGQLVSKEAISRANNGEQVPCVVTIGFIHRGQRFIAERVANYVKIDNEVRSEKSDFTFTRILKSGNSKTEFNPIGVMNSILPANVRPYFFFDGEKMDDLTKAGSKDVEDAVRNIMRLPTIERAQEHLQGIAIEFRRELKKKGSPEIEKLISQEEGIRNNREKLMKRREELRENIRLGRQQIADMEEKLRGSEVAKELQKRRDTIQKLLEELEQRERDLIVDIQKFANRSYIAILGDVAQKALTIVDDKREKGEIPSGIREKFILDLIDKGICVCGRAFSMEDEAHQHLTALLRRSTSSKLENEVIRMAGALHSLSMNATNTLDSINNRNKDLGSTKETSARLYAELDDLKRQVIDTTIEEIIQLERQRMNFQRLLETSLAEQGRIEAEISILDKQIIDLQKQREAAEKKEKEISLLARKESLAQRAADAVAQIKEQFFEHTRLEIEKATKDVFSRLAWKQDHFQDVCLDQDFRMEVIDRWGTPTRKELSAGERQILSLSFIAAMSRLSNEEAPLVMDTPFGRLSGQHLKAVAENLPGLTPQLILFVTDREWDEASRTQLEPRTGFQYDLYFDEKAGCTEIKEIDI